MKERSLPDQGNPRDISYLLRGSPRQQAAFQALQSLGLFEALADYTPLLVGTLPLGLDLPGSDLDILCEVHDSQAFTQRARSLFAHHQGFIVREKPIDSLPVVIVRLQYGGFPVEIFGQPRPVLQQRACRHMRIEARLLEIGGEGAFEELHRLRSSGYKTEPAFAQAFGLPGDPYDTLLELESLDRLGRLSERLAALRVKDFASSPTGPSSNIRKEADQDA